MHWVISKDQTYYKKTKLISSNILGWEHTHGPKSISRQAKYTRTTFLFIGAFGDKGFGSTRFGQRISTTKKCNTPKFEKRTFNEQNDINFSTIA